jgi:hypothetical protein
MTWSRRATGLAIAIVATAACNGARDSAGPEPIPPRQFNLQFMDNGSLPAFLWQDPAFGGEWHLESATLIPYAVGRTVDQRLINDRTGRGASGGNTRDTTVARGQFMDIRVLRQVVKNAEGLPSGVVFRKDSTLVDAEVRDTTLVIRRSAPNKTLSGIDTGYFVGDRLVMSTTLDYLATFGIPRRTILLTYQLSR